MCAQNTEVGREDKKHSKGFKILIWVSTAIVLILLILVIGIPAYLSSTGGKGFVVKKVNQSIDDGRFDMGDLSVGWGRGINASDVSFEGDEGATSVRVKRISAKPNYASFLAGNISLDDVVLDSPKVIVSVREAMEEEAVESDNQKPAQKSDNGFNLQKLDLTVKNGDVKIIRFGQAADSQTVHFSNIASKIDLNKPGKQSQFDVDFLVADSGTQSKVSANGSVKRPKKKWSLSELDGNLNMKVDNLDLKTLEPVLVLIGKEDVEVSGIVNVDAKAQVDKGKVEDLSVDAVIDGFSQTVDGKPITVDEPVTLKAQVSQENEKIKIDEFKLQSSFLSVTAGGTAEEIDYTAKADIGKTMDVVGTFVDLGGYSFSGQGVEEGKISINGDKVRISDDASVSNFIIKKNGKTSPSLTSKFTFDLMVNMAEEKVRIDYITMKTADSMADIAVNDSVFAWGDDAESQLDMQVDAEIELEKAQEFAKFFEAIPENMNIAGMLKSKISVESQDDALRMFTDDTQIANLKVDAEGAEKAFTDDLVQAKLDMIIGENERKIKFEVKGSQIDVSGDFVQGPAEKIGMEKLAGNAVANYDLQDVSTLASAYLPKGLTMRGSRSDQIDFSSVYPADQPDKLVRNMNASGKFGFESAEYMGMNIGQTDVPIKIDSGVLMVEPFTTSVNEGKLNFAGSMDMTKQPIVFRTPGPLQIVENINVNEKMSQELLMYLNPIFADQSEITGIANFQCDELVLPLGGEAPVRDIRVKGTVSMNNLLMRLQGLMGQALRFARTRPNVTADVLPTDFLMADGKLSYDNMQVNIDEAYPLNFSGSVQIAGDPKRLDMEATLPYKVAFNGANPKLETVRIGEDVENRVTLPIEGTVSNTSINYQKFLNEMIKEGGEEMLRRGIEKGLRDLFK